MKPNPSFLLTSDGHSHLNSDVSEALFTPFTTSHSESLGTFGARACYLRYHSVLHSAAIAQKNKKRRCQGDGDGTLFRGRDVRRVGPRISQSRLDESEGWTIFGGASRRVTQQSAAKSKRTHSISGGRLSEREREIHSGGEQGESFPSSERRQDCTRMVLVKFTQKGEASQPPSRMTDRWQRLFT